MKKHIPNTITLCNLLAGCTGVVFALRGQFSATLLCVLLSGLFDFFDGFAARKLHVVSPIGKELDSLADMVSFGLSPAVSLLAWYGAAQPALRWLGYAALLIAAFSALRLAKFNLDERQTSSFIGLPTPACALLVIPLCVYAQHTDGFLHQIMATVWFIPVLSVVLSALLVCELPMFSLKKTTGLMKAFIAGAVVLIAACLIREIKAPWYVTVSLCIFLILVYYLVLNLAAFKRK